MSKWKFSRAHIPAFIYLMDQVLKDDVYKEDDNIYLKIATEGTLDRETIHQRTIQRAFDLREQLKQQTQLTIKEVHKPTLKTLNVITNYYFEGKPSTFLKFEKENKVEIVAHYSLVEQSDKILDIVFEQVPSKIELIQEHISALEGLLEELKEGSLESFVNTVTEKRLAGMVENQGAEAMRTELEEFIRARIKASEEKMRRASLLYRFLGGFGLLFVAAPNFLDFKGMLIDDFMDDNDDVPDDLVEEDDLDDMEDDDDLDPLF
ncbi:hypothetical protein [Kriegella aquimaris]|nr:hypothetical protein [Kriegella aquimaris]